MHLEWNFQDSKENFLWEQRIMPVVTRYYHRSAVTWPRAFYMSDLVCCFEAERHLCPS